MAPFERFCEGVARQLGTPEPSARELYAIGEELLMLCAKIDTAFVADLVAAPGEERLHPIAVSASGGLLVLDAAQIHSTRVDGTASTLHLHLYGRALSALPRFSARCFDA